MTPFASEIRLKILNPVSYKDFLIFQKKICFREKIGVTVEEQPCKKGTRLLLLLFAQANLT